jgi:hypothetical protein
MSDWNLFLERKLDLDLGLEESRLADAIARSTLGWNSRENAVGQHLLRDLAKLHGRSFERARRNLEAKGLIAVRPGSGGRGNRDTYSLLLDEHEHAEATSGIRTPATERANRRTPANERGNGAESSARSHGQTAAQTATPTPARTAAEQRVRIENGEEGRAKEESGSRSKELDLEPVAPRPPAAPATEDSTECHDCKSCGAKPHGSTYLCSRCIARRESILTRNTRFDAGPRYDVDIGTLL